MTQTIKKKVCGSTSFHASYKKRRCILMYVLLTNDPKVKQHEIPLYTKQYESYKYSFKKKNVNMLPKHLSYNCAIDLEKGI
jgi:hypothetical protein